MEEESAQQPTVEDESAERASVEELIADRLAESGLSSRASELVLAAVLGNEELATAINKASHFARARHSEAPATNQLRPLYLRSIVVKGFRGIGPEAALRLQPGPGLTVVAGRNGSGKSSFAEAAELALTGDNMRWSGRSAVWRDGWRNLHTSGESKICTELTADGQPGVLRVTREWPAGTALDTASSYIQATGKPREPLESAKWTQQLELFRPFLSYAELGDLVSGKPSEMYDAVQAILGLDQLVSAEKLLNEERRRLDEPSKLALKRLPELRARLAECSDERAREAEKAIARRPWDLAVVEALAVGTATTEDPVATRLSQIHAIELPTGQAVAAAIEELGRAAKHVAELGATPAADARRLAALLTAALEHQAGHPGEPCPVCASRALDAAWAEHAHREVERLRGLAQDADQAYRRLDATTEAVRDLIGSRPSVLSLDIGPDVDGTEASVAWDAWVSLARNGALEGLTAAGPERFATLREAVTRLQADAAAALTRRAEAWQPVAAELGAWAGQARSSERAATNLDDVKQALAWLRAVGQEIRDARMAPFTAKSAQVWSMLRQESNVDLGPIRLAGSSTQRRVSLDVTVDGVSGAALSVMSQGELHALGLALFLPRATSSDSPFRFIVIDDPVQAMDPAKVDGLARLLAQVGEDRQVVVFTHDDRLPEALRRLQLHATIWEVTRREHSIVELRKNDDPVSRYLDDARAMARTSELPEDVRAVVVTGFCRSALEAACHEAVRARRITAGVPYGAVERELVDADKLRLLVALAMLDDASRGGEVVPELRRRYGQAAVKAFDAAKEGTHARYEGDLRHLVEETARLAERLRA